jgi:hypothetical protein
MRRESDNNLSSNSSNAPHGNFTSGENNLSHLNYHPIHGYGASNYSGYQSSKCHLSKHRRDMSTSRVVIVLITQRTIQKLLFFSKGNRPNSNSALISAAAATASSSSSTSQNQLEEYVDILQVQQLLLDNSTVSTSSSSTVNTASYTSPASTAMTSSASKNLQSRPRVNLQKAAEFAQVQGNFNCKMQ